jgi:DNA polymerase-1
MPPQTLLKRVERLCSDACADPTVDVRARWAKIAETVGAEADAALGGIPEPTLDDIEPDKAIFYACRDADGTNRINPILDAEIDRMGLRSAVEIDYAVIPMLCRMMSNGMLVDRPHLATLEDAFGDALADLEYRCHQLAGRRFLVTSGDQVDEILTELGLVRRRKTPTGKRYSTDEKTLQALKGQHPIVSLILEHRELSKLQSSYVEKLPKLLSPDGRIRMELGMTTVPSGRLNCWGGVNLLAIPVRSDLGKEIRRAFIAPPGCVLGSVDLNQIEMRAMAIISGDERMLQAYADGVDIHTQTAQFMFRVKEPTTEQRHHGKQVGFGIINGITAMGLLDQMILRGATDWDEGDCQRLINLYLEEVYPGVGRMFEATWEEGRRNGYIRCSLSGRILYTPGLRSPIEKVRAEAERVATNWKIQTWAQTVMKLGMALVWQAELGFGALLQVHDELLLENSQDFDAWDVVSELLCSGHSDVIPVTAGYKVGRTWADLKE